MRVLDESSLNQKPGGRYCNNVLKQN